MKQLLSFEQIKKKLQWCTEMASKNWNSVIFTDESTFVLKKSIKESFGVLLE